MCENNGKTSFTRMFVIYFVNFLRSFFGVWESVSKLTVFYLAIQL